MPKMQSGGPQGRPDQVPAFQKTGEGGKKTETNLAKPNKLIVLKQWEV